MTNFCLNTCSVGAIPRGPVPLLDQLDAAASAGYSGVGLDVAGRGFDQFPSELREEIVARYPRKHFKESFIQEYFAGFAHKPGTTYGTVNSGICERLIPGYKAANAYDVITASPFPNSE